MASATPTKVSPLAMGLRPKGKRGRPSKQEREQMIAHQRSAGRPKNETPEKRIARISERFTVMYRLTQGAINGVVRALIVSGAPGVGKSYTIEQLLADATEKGKIRHQIIRGSLSGINLYKQMYAHSRKNDIILLDDADSIYEDEDAMNLLKAGLDTTKVRKLSWLSEANALKSEDIPTQFVYEGSIIFITNMDFQSIIDYGKNRMVPHFSALMSRSIYLDLQLHDLDDVVAWVSHMIRKNMIMVDRGVAAAQQEVGLKWLAANYPQCRELSIRTMLKLADFMVTDPAKWDVFARATLLR